MTDSAAADPRDFTAAVSEHDRAFFGHPRGLSTLFFTEMWERFSYYGMRALLLLFMTAPVRPEGSASARPREAPSTAVHVDGVHDDAARRLDCRPIHRSAARGALRRHPDRVWPLQHGGADLATFYLGLFLIVIGTGLLKGNVSVMVGYLYSKEDKRRDAGFSLFYMGINMGAFFAPARVRISWPERQLAYRIRVGGRWHAVRSHSVRCRRPLSWRCRPAPGAAESPQPRQHSAAAPYSIGSILVAAIALFARRDVHGRSAHHRNPGGRCRRIFPAVPHSGVLRLAVSDPADWTPEERHRLYAIGALFLAAAIFWSVFEQAGSTLNLFADRNTNNVLLGLPFPSSWFQSENSLFLWMLAPVFAWLWLRLGDQGNEPSSPAKFAMALIFVGAGFAILIIPRDRAARSARCG